MTQKKIISYSFVIFQINIYIVINNNSYITMYK